jgi:hypothetical protein
MGLMTPELRAELSEALRRNDGKLGIAFELIEKGMSKRQDLIDGGAAANSGAAGNIRVTLEAILDGKMPSGPTVARQSRSSINGLLKNNPDLSDAARTYLDGLRNQLEVIASDPKAIENEEVERVATSSNLKRKLADSPGVYVFTLPTFLRVPQKEDPERFWFKIGMTERSSGSRTNEIARSVGLPEDFLIVRVYQHETVSLASLEKKFHRIVESAGHSRAVGERTGTEWFATNLEFLDAIAEALDCRIEGDFSSVEC